MFGSDESAIDAKLCAGLYQAGFCLGYVVAIILLPRLPRRYQAAGSTAIFSISSLGLGLLTNYSCQASPEQRTSYQIGILTLLVVNAMAYTVGLGGVFFSLVGEVYPPAVSGFFCSLTMGFR